MEESMQASSQISILLLVFTQYQYLFVYKCVFSAFPQGCWLKHPFEKQQSLALGIEQVVKMKKVGNNNRNVVPLSPCRSAQEKGSERQLFVCASFFDRYQERSLAIALMNTS